MGPNGTGIYKSDFSKGYVFSAQLGTLIWDRSGKKCPKDRVSFLYTGTAQKLTSSTLPPMLYVNQPTEGGQLFLDLYETIVLCDM